MRISERARRRPLQTSASQGSSPSASPPSRPARSGVFGAFGRSGTSRRTSLSVPGWSGWLSPFHVTNHAFELDWHAARSFHRELRFIKPRVASRRPRAISGASDSSAFTVPAATGRRPSPRERGRAHCGLPAECVRCRPPHVDDRVRWQPPRALRRCRSRSAGSVAPADARVELDHVAAGPCRSRDAREPPIEQERLRGAGIWGGTPRRSGPSQSLGNARRSRVREGGAPRGGGEPAGPTRAGAADRRWERLPWE